MSHTDRGKMDWHKLISDRRFGLEDYEVKESTRTDFQRDYDRLIFSAPFRRLQNKTQVFPLPGKIFVHNRLTHSLEVSCIGRSLGTQVGRAVKERHPDLEADFSDFGAIVSAACLAHDMGNPPFGHAGERAITAYFTEGKGRKWEAQVRDEGCRWEDFAHFEGNANAIRLLTHAFEGRRAGGFVLTYSTLASIVKYPYTSKHNAHKFGFFETEEASYAKIADHLGLLRLSPEGELPVYARHPLVYLVEAADDICYQIMDIEDAFKLKILSYEETTGLLFGFFDEERKASLLKMMERVQDTNERIAYLRSSAIGVLVDACVQTFLDHEDEILSATFDSTLIKKMPARPREAYEACQKVAYGRIYNAKEVVDIELAGFRIFEYLLETVIKAQLQPDHAYSKLWFNRIPSQYELNRTTLYGKIQTALDYISGMTDVYALDVYRKFTGMSLPAV